MKQKSNERHAQLYLCKPYKKLRSHVGTEQRVKRTNKSSQFHCSRNMYKTVVTTCKISRQRTVFEFAAYKSGTITTETAPLLS